MTLLHRYWIRFEFGRNDRRPIGSGLGCGVTAYSVDDALAIARERLFGGAPLPELKELIEDVDVSGLDAAHVMPNMGNVAVRGVWFPQGYDQ